MLDISLNVRIHGVTLPPMILRILLLLSLLSFTACTHVPTAENDGISEKPTDAAKEETPLQAAVRHDAQKIIDACWAISLEDRDSGVTARMKSGTYRTIDCLTTQISSISKDYIKNSDNRTEFLRELQVYTSSGYTLYNHIFLSHSGCQPCGSFYNVAYTAHVANLLEQIIYTMFAQAEDHSFKIIAN